MYKFRLTDFIIEKKLLISLKNIYGMGWLKSNFILSKLGININIFVNTLNIYYKNLLFFYLENYITSIAYINRYISLKIKKLIDLNTYKGIRHKLSLPVNGQRTRTNANTQRSKRINKI